MDAPILLHTSPMHVTYLCEISHIILRLFLIVGVLTTLKQPASAAGVALLEFMSYGDAGHPVQTAASLPLGGVKVNHTVWRRPKQAMQYNILHRSNALVPRYVEARASQICDLLFRHGNMGFWDTSMLFLLQPPSRDSVHRPVSHDRSMADNRLPYYRSCSCTHSYLLWLPAATFLAKRPSSSTRPLLPRRQYSVQTLTAQAQPHGSDKKT